MQVQFRKLVILVCIQLKYDLVPVSNVYKKCFIGFNPLLVKQDLMRLFAHTTSDWLVNKWILVWVNVRLHLDFKDILSLRTKIVIILSIVEVLWWQSHLLRFFIADWTLANLWFVELILSFGQCSAYIGHLQFVFFERPWATLLRTDLFIRLLRIFHTWMLTDKLL